MKESPVLSKTSLNAKVKNKNSVKTTLVDKKENYVPIGDLYLKAHKKEHEVVDIEELRREFNKDYMDNLTKAAMAGKKRLSNLGSFFVVVLMKRERLMKKVLRNYFTSRKTCPTPTHDQTVYIFNPKTEELSFLWVIPAKDICEIMYSQKYSLNSINNNLMPYVVDFMEGRLYRKMVELNNTKEIKDLSGRRKQ